MSLLSLSWECAQDNNVHRNALHTFMNVCACAMSVAFWGLTINFSEYANSQI